MNQALQSLGPPYDSNARAGLQALRPVDRNAVQIANPRRLTGSIDLDATLNQHPRHASANRWDYGVGFLHDDVRCAVWIEVHGATTSREVDAVCRKHEWLVTWLRVHGPELPAMTSSGSKALGHYACIWISTGGVNFQSSTKARRKLAQAGLSMPKRAVRLP